MDQSASVSMEAIQGFRRSYENNIVSQVATRAASKSAVDDICYDTQHAKKMNHKFSVDIPTMGAVNQKHS